MSLDAIPEDWLKDILIYFDVVSRYRLRRCCRTWRQVLDCKSIRRTSVVKCTLATATRPDSCCDQQKLLHRISDVTKDVDIIIWTGELVSDPFPKWSRFSWGNTMQMLLCGSSWQPMTRRYNINMESVAKWRVIFYDIPRALWWNIQECWLSNTASSLELKNVTLDLEGVWTHGGSLWWDHPSFCRDTWLCNQYLSQSMQNHSNQGIKGHAGHLIYRPSSPESFRQLILDILPLPPADEVTSTLVRLQDVNQQRLQEVVGIILEEIFPGTVLPKDNILEYVRTSYPIVLWFLMHWNGVN